MKRILICLFVVVLTVCSGCASPAATLVTQTMAEPETLDVQNCVSMEAGFFGTHIFDRLMEFDRQGKLVPGLLEGYPTVSDDGRVYHFKLKEGLRFSDGSPLGSRDVKFTVERALSPALGGWNAWIYDSILGAESVAQGESKTLQGFVIKDDLSFEIRLKEPYTPFVQGLASPFAGIFPEKGCQNAGDRWGQQVMGSGPYMLEVWEKGKRIVLKRNKNYWGEMPAIERIDTLFVTDYFQNLSGFRNHAVDCFAVPEEEYYGLSRDAELRGNLLTVQSKSIYYLSFNLAHPQLQDVQIRQAISMAIDRTALTQNVMHGAVIPAHTYLPPGIPGYDPVSVIPYDIEKAKALLASSGYPEGFDLDYPCVQIIEADYALKSMLDQIGIRLNIRSITSGERKELVSRNADTLILRYWWADIPDGDNFLYNKFNSQMAKVGNYQSAVFDQRSIEARTISDPLQREALYRQLDKQLCQEDWVVAPLYHHMESLLVAPRLKGVYINPVTAIPSFKEAVVSEAN